MTKSTNNPKEFPLGFSLEERFSVPQSDSLERSILEETIQLQQQPHLSSSIEPKSKPQFLRGVLSLPWLSAENLKPIMALSVVAFTMILIFNLETNSGSDASLDSMVRGQEQVQPELILTPMADQSMDSLDWQELLLLQDELAFASL